MQQDSTLVLVAGVGLALVCVGIVAVGMLLLIRRVGVPLLGALLGGGEDDEHRRIVRAAPKPDLRSIAQNAASDFDAALARGDAQAQGAPPPFGTPPAASPTPPPPFGTPPAASPVNPAPFADAAPRLGSRRASTRPRPTIDDDDDDDLLGAVLDDEP